MKLILKSAVSAALFTAAVSAHAQLAVVPTAPSTYPGNTAISPGSNNTVPGNGGVLVEAFDPLTGKSLTEYLGFNFSQFTPATAVTPTGGTNDFGVIGGQTLWNATFGSGSTADTNPIDFVVVSANNAVSGATSILTTLSPGTVPSSAIKNNSVANAAASFQGAVGLLTSGQQSTATQTAGANPAQTLATTDNGYGVVTDLGTQWGGTFTNSAGTAGGGAVDFYEFTNNGTTGTGTSGNKVANAVQYQNANGAATWTLSATGDLVYAVPGGSGGAPVPLPAAVWLLGSGLLGLAGIGRRRALKA
jgi:hypothetical protein